MKFNNLPLTFSGSLRQIWRKKEYGWIYSGLHRVKVRCRIKQRERMVKGIDKMEKDMKDGRGYSSGICLCDDDGNEEGEEPTSKRARRSDNNKLTRKSSD
jgi:hypothetical protein